MLTQEAIKAFLRYDPESGDFTRLNKNGQWTPCNGVHKATGYRVIGIKHVPHLAHRLAFLYMTGEWPKDQVDHINGVRTDNRWVNLRDVTDGVNKQNRQGPQVNNQVGRLGVSYWGKRRGQKKHVAQLVLDGRRVHCSYHRTPEEAHIAYLKAKREHHEGNTL